MESSGSLTPRPYLISVMSGSLEARHRHWGFISKASEVIVTAIKSENQSLLRGGASGGVVEKT